MTTAERIDEILKLRKMSRREFAIKAEIPPSSFQSAMERNKSFSLDMLCKITQTLDLSLYAILGDEERKALGFHRGGQ